MNKVLVDRELLERWADKLEDADRSGYGWEDLLAEEIRSSSAQPAEVEGVEVVAFLMRPDLYEPYVSLSRDSHCGGSTAPLMTVAQHLAALSAVTAERDQLRAEAEVEVEGLRKVFGECIQSLHDEMLQGYSGQKPDDMHPVTRRNYDRNMAEIAEYRTAMAAKEPT